jgi:hypothetical protein
MGEATLTLVQAQTGTTNRSLTNAEGQFQFPSVLSGEYNLRVEKQGFRVFERRKYERERNERLSLGDLPLALGSVTETVLVDAETTGEREDRSGISAGCAISSACGTGPRCSCCAAGNSLMKQCGSGKSGSHRCSSSTCVANGRAR